MKRKLVALLVNLLVDLLLNAFSLVFRLKDNSPGITVTNFRELAEALAREGPIVTTQIRHAGDMRESLACVSADAPSAGHHTHEFFVHIECR